MKQEQNHDMTHATSNVKGLILDFGGTIDTDGQHWGKMLWEAYRKVGVPVTEEAFREAYVYGERTLEHHPLIQPHDTLQRTIDVKLRLQLEQLCIIGAWNAHEAELKRVHKLLSNHVYGHLSSIIVRNREVLSMLYPHYPMVLVTNFYGNMRQVLNEFQLDNLFVDVIESAVVNIRKPDNRIFKMAVDSLQIAPDEVLVVGDSFYKDIEPAAKLGCKTAWLKGEGWTDKQYDESVPTCILTKLSHLLDLQNG